MEKVFVYKPRAVALIGEDEKIDTGFTGTIKVAIPDYTTRLGIIKDHTPKDGEDQDFAAMGEKMFKTVNTYVKEVDFKHPDCDEPLTSVEDLGMFDVGTAVIFDLGNMIMKGWSPNPKS